MKFQSNTYATQTGQYYRRIVAKHPFLLFGLPFVAMIVAGSFALAPVTATKYENHDRKMKWASNQEAFDNSGLKRRKFDAREEYYVSLGIVVIGTLG